MTNLSKEEKKALKRKYKKSQEKSYILDKTNVEKLFEYLEEKLEVESCNETLFHTMKWLENNVSPDKIESIIEELEEQGGYCDCEVLFNCYEIYGF